MGLQKGSALLLAPAPGGLQKDTHVPPFPTLPHCCPQGHLPRHPCSSPGPTSADTPSKKPFLISSLTGQAPLCARGSCVLPDTLSWSICLCRSLEDRALQGDPCDPASHLPWQGLREVSAEQMLSHKQNASQKDRT